MIRATNASTDSPDIGLFVQRIPAVATCTGGAYSTVSGGSSITCSLPYHGNNTLLFGVVFLKGTAGNYNALTGCDAACQTSTGQPPSSPVRPLGINVPYVSIAAAPTSTFKGLTTPSVCEPNPAINPNAPSPGNPGTAPQTPNCINYARGDGKFTGLQFFYNGKAARNSSETITFQQSIETVNEAPDGSGPTGATYASSAFYTETITFNFV